MDAELVAFLTPAEVIGRAAVVLVRSVRPFVEAHSPDDDPHRTWVDVYEEQARRNGLGERRYALEDPRFLLQILVQHWRRFDRRVSRAATGYARELRETLNQVAHAPTTVTVPAAARAIDTCRLLLRSLELHTSSLADLDDLVRGLYADAEASLGECARPSARRADLPAFGLPTRSEKASRGIDEAPDTEAATLSEEPKVALSRGDEALEESVPVATDDPVADLDLQDVDGDVTALEGGLRRLVLRHGAVTLTVTTRESLNYALVTNGIGPVVEIVAKNASQQPAIISDVSIDIDLGEVPANALQGRRQPIPPLRVPPEAETRLTAAQLTLPLQPSAFAALDEASSALLQVEATIVGERRMGVVPIRLLARNEWTGRSIPELLAAFITPNDPALEPLLEGLADRMQSTTGNPSLDGYQGGPERARALAKAAYEVIAAQNIVYSVEQASFEIEGQKIRSVGDVLTLRRATCLDLVVLYCSLIEAVGLHPTVIHVPDHALAGVLVADGQLSDVAVSDHSMLHNLSLSGKLLPLEITGASGGDCDFDEAVHRGQQWFRESHGLGDPGVGHIVHILDVRSAHRRVRPLPRLRVDVSGIAVVETERSATRATPPYAQDPAPSRTSREPQRPPRVERWRSSLLDLSLRNPLLKLRDTSGIVLAIDEVGIAELENALHLGRKFQLRSAANIGELEVARGLASAMDLDPEVQRRIMRDEQILYVDTRLAQHPGRLDRLRRNCQLTIEETGANNLFLTLGALRWTDGKGSDAYAPLLLLPMKLTGNRKTPYHMAVAEGAEALPNYCLIEKLRRDFDLVIPALQDPPADETGVDVARIFQELRLALIEHQLPYTVEPHCRLALLQFATLEMWRDVTENWRQLMERPVVRHLVETPLDSFVDVVPAPSVDAVDEATACLPVPVDGEQLKAIRWATSGRTFILEGPPGTGKSQTITNMIADCLAAGRTVLFVAEKQAALDVVRRRLDEVGIGRLTLDLHGVKQSVTRVRAQIRDAWETEGSGTYSALMESRSRLVSLVEKLDAYPAAVHQLGPAGVSAWAAYAEVSALETRYPADTFAGLRYQIPASVFLSDDAVGEARAALGRLVSSLEVLRRTQDREAWSLVGLAAEPTPQQLGQLADELTTLLTSLDPAIRAALGAIPTTAWDALATWVDAIERGHAIRPSDLPQCSGPAFELRRQRLLEEVTQHQVRFAALLPILTPATDNIRVDHIRKAIADADRRSVFRRRRARKAVLRNVVSRCARPDAVSWESLPRFLDDLEQYRMDVGRLTAALATLTPGGCDHVGGVDLRASHDRVMATVESTREIIDQAGQLEVLDALWVKATRRSGSLLSGSIRSFTQAWLSLRQLLDVTPTGEQHWLGDVSLLDRLQTCLATWSAAAARGRLTELERTRRIAGDVAELRSMGLGALVDDAFTTSVKREHVQVRFQYRIASERLAERLASTNLDTVDMDSRSRDVERYRSTSADVRAAMSGDIIARARRSRGFDRNHPTPDQAALLKWAQMARGGSIRKGIAHHGKAMLQVTPCFMMSPSSVARHVPVDAIGFDLVIFDEASQIKVADAVGSLGRASSAVIVGDSKQMPPTSMFEAGVGVGDEEINEEDDQSVTPVDQESILSEAVTSNIERLALTWHYRSRDETLIAFSNAEYYEGKLASFPTPPVHAAQAGISVRHVGGVFERGSRSANRVNTAEANAILNEVKRRLARVRPESVGVVTFNIQQRDLIADLLEDCDAPAVREALKREDEPLFVKNLENVQGDERDVILFSLAFSPDPATKRMSLNFGPLTRHGGERRLNVAITRARAEIMLFTSFRPQDIDLARTSSVGMHHLRRYLAYAEDVARGNNAQGSTTTVDPYRSQLARELAVAGMEVQEDLGLSAFRVDVAVRRPGHRWLAVVLDGPGWGSRRIVADRDGIPAPALQRMGWADTVQVLLPEWVADRAAVTRRLVAAADELPRERRHQSPLNERSTSPPVSRLARESPQTLPDPTAAEPLPEDKGQTSHAVVGRRSETPSEASGGPAVAVSTVPVPGHRRARERPTDWERIARSQPLAPPSPVATSEPSGLPRRQTFQGADRTARVDRYHLEHWYERTSAARLRGQISAVLEAEAPIGARRLAQIVGNRCGFQRLYADRENDILRCVDADVVRQDLGRLGVWYWAPGADPEAYGVFRTGPVHHRPIQDVPPIEALNAMRWVLGVEGPQPLEELLRLVNRELGANRFGGGIREHLHNVLVWALDSGRLVSQDGLIVTPSH